MADISKIQNGANGTVYNIVDASAVHTVDSSLSSSSENPVQNKVIKGALDGKKDVVNLGSLTATSLGGDQYSISGIASADVTKINAMSAPYDVAFSTTIDSTSYVFNGGYDCDETINGGTYHLYSGTMSDGHDDAVSFVFGVLSTGTTGLLSLVEYVEFGDLATVATTGDYNDLLNKPTDANGIVPIAKGGTGIAVADAGNWYTSMTLHPHFEVHYDMDTTTFTAVYHGPLDGISSVQTALQSDAVKMALSSEVPVFSGSALLFNGTIMTNAMGGSPESVFILFPDAVTFLTLIVNGIRGTLTYDSNDGLYLSSVAANQPYWYTTWRPSLFFDGLNGEGQLGPSRTLDTLYQSNGVIYASATDIAITSDKVTKYSTDATIATGDKIGIFDSSDSNKLKSTSISFDTTNTSDFLRKDGTFATPPNTGDFDHIIEISATPDLSTGVYTVSAISPNQATILSWITSTTDTCAVLLRVGAVQGETDQYTLLLPETSNDGGLSNYDDVTAWFCTSTENVFTHAFINISVEDGAISLFDVGVGSGKVIINDTNIDPSGLSSSNIVGASSETSIASGDRIAIFDASDGRKLKRSSIALGNSTTTYLRNDGTWATPSTGLPSVTSADNGKVLMVVNGAWAVASLPLYDGSVT